MRNHMDENHQDKTESKLIATEDKLWLPPLSLKDQKRLAHLQKKHIPQWTGFSGKTLWDWLQLLLIPLVLTVGGFLFSNYQHNSDQQQALDQQQATILQTYIDNIQDLLLNHNLLGDSPPPKNDADKVTIQEVQELARSRTLTALKGLDPDRKVRLLQFLFEAHLIGFRDSHDKAQQPIIDLAGADL